MIRINLILLIIAALSSTLSATVTGIQGALELFDGSLQTALKWKGGKEEPVILPVEFSLSDSIRIGKISLFSVSKDRYWQIAEARLQARSTLDADWEEIGRKKWYSRKENDSSDTGCKEYELSFTLPEKKFRFFRIELSKAHPYLFANLAEIRFFQPEKSKEFRILTTYPQLFESPSGKVQFRGGRTEPSNLFLAAYLFHADPIQKLQLDSISPNQYFSIPKLTVSALSAQNGKFEELFQKDWYKRDDSETTTDTGSRKFTINIPLKEHKYSMIAFTLTRPNHWLHIVLNAIRFNPETTTECMLILNRHAFYAGQTANGKLYLKKLPIAKGKQAEVSIISINEKGEKKEFFRQTISPDKAEQEIPVQLTFAEKGRYRLETELKINGQPIPVSTSRLLVETVEKDSRFFFPVGTCFSNAETPAYGFSVVHRWERTLASPPSVEQNRDFYAEMLRSGIRMSTCINQVPWLDFRSRGIAEEDSKMKFADGKTGKYLSFHLPGKTLDPIFSASAKQWDGHPGLYQYVYNNEICYISWLMGGFVDYSKYALVDYTRYLRELYKDISSLNKRYASTYRNFSEVTPPREFNGAGPAWFDWMQFRVKANADYAHTSYKALKKVLPQTIITPKPISSNEDYFAASKAIDPWLWKGAYDVFGFDLYPWHRDGFYSTPMSLDFHRTQVNTDIHCTESGLSYSTPFLTDRDERVFNATYWPAFLRGMKACYWFEWYVPWEKHQRGFWLSLPDGSLTQLGREAVRMSKQVQTLAPILNTGKVKKAQIAILWPWADIMQTPNLSVVNSARGAYKLISQLHYLSDMISEHNIRNGELAKYRVLLLPWSKHLQPDSCLEIKKFIANGGIVFADMQAGMYNHHHEKKDSLDTLFGIKQRTPFKKVDNFFVGKNEYTCPLILTTPSPFPGKASTASESNVEKLTVLDNVDILARYSDNFPALLRKRFGKGITYYFANAWFASNRNFFYSRSSAPVPSTRAAEIANRIPPQNLELMRGLLAENGIQPELILPTEHHTWLDDERRFIIFSALESPYGDLYGFTNWGPRPMHSLPVEFSIPGKKYTKLYMIDTAEETWKSIPFTQTNGRLKTEITNLASTTLLLAVSTEAPLFADAIYDPIKKNVEITLNNGMNQKLSGTIQLKIDGLSMPLSRKLSFEIREYSNRKYFLPITGPAENEWFEKNGKPRPWYVWITYDGNARSFSKVQLFETIVH